MKALKLVLLLTFVSSFAFAQPAKRVSALNYLKYGELDKAKENIDAAVLHEKTMRDPKSWYYRGMIYQSIHTSKEYKSLDANASDVAFESYKKALVYNFMDPTLQNLNLEDQTDVLKFFMALNDSKTRFVDQELLVDILMNQFPPLSNMFVNKGVEVYQNDKDYKKAYDLFNKSLFVSGMSMRVDTPVIYYSAIVAEKAGLYKEAKESFELLVKLNYGKNDKDKATNYYFLGNIYKAMGDTTKFIETLKKGIEKYPTSNTLVVELVNHYITVNATSFKVTFTDAAGASAQSEGANTWEKSISMKKGAVLNLSAQVTKGNDIKVQIFVKDKMVKEAANTGANCSANTTFTLDADAKVRFLVTTPSSNEKADKSSKFAVDYLELATTNNPTNPTLWYAKGSLYDGSMKDTLKAIDCYKKAIELDAKFFDAIYNLGALYFNHGADIMLKANALPQDKEKEYEALKLKADAEFNLALPYLENAHALNDKDKPTLESLKNIYYRLGQLEKMEEVKKKLEVLK